MLTYVFRFFSYYITDQSPAAALRRIQLQLKEDADYLLRGRVRIIK
jgi:hypothetical protein